MIGLWIFMILAALNLAGCTRISGVVLERGTEKPMANAFVILTWRGSADLYVQTASRCYRAQVTQTDSQGRFTFPPDINSGNPSLDVYLPNYNGRAELGTPNLLYVDVRRGTQAEKFQAISRMQLGGNCDGASSDKARIPLERARALEMQGLAQTEDERRLADQYLQSSTVLDPKP